MKISSILIANRGEIACRVIRACRDLNIRSVAVYSEADRDAAFVTLADEAYEIGPASLAESYLNIDRILRVAADARVDAIHPGYGFLSENAEFARRVAQSGIIFIGPSPSSMAAMGEKVPARDLMRQAGVPIVPGSDALASLEEALAAAETVGYPVLLKASAGGGGIGMRAVSGPDVLGEVWDSARTTAERAFGNGTLFLEHFVEDPRHIEIQVIGDTHGNYAYVGERECSVQRRHQKIIEETPSPALTDALRAEMGEAAVKAARSVGYTNAGTVEFIFSRGSFFFLEMNARLQVEHPITEEIFGVDLVAEQIRVARGETLSFRQEDLQSRGHAIECRINAEDARKAFRPAPGKITKYREPCGPGVRVDSGITRPSTISPYFDPMIAKLIVWGPDRPMAIERMKRALLEYVIAGVTTNISYHLAVLDSEVFRSGTYTTRLIDEHPELIEAMDSLDVHRERFVALTRDLGHIAAVAGAVAATT